MFVVGRSILIVEGFIKLLTAFRLSTKYIKFIKLLTALRLSPNIKFIFGESLK